MLNPESDSLYTRPQFAVDPMQKYEEANEFIHKKFPYANPHQIKFAINRTKSFILKKQLPWFFNNYI
jgi:hypothetical protein